MTHSSSADRAARGYVRRIFLRRGAVLAGTGAGAWLVACGGGTTAKKPGAAATTAPSGAASAAAAGSPAAAAAAFGPPRGRLVFGTSAEVGSADPHSLAGGGPGNWMAAGLFDSLSGVNRVTRDIIPGAAASWKLLDDRLTWEFKIRPGVTFHNGEPLDATAVKFSYDRQFGKAAYNPGFKPNGYLKAINEVKIVDPLTVQIVTAAPNPVVEDIATPLVPPKFITEKGDDEYARVAYGTGPFKLVEQKRGESLTMEANEQYFTQQRSQAIRGLPYVKTLVQKVIPEDETRIAALTTGEVDIIFTVPVDSIKRLQTQKDVGIAVSQNTAPVVLQVNWLDDMDPSGNPNPLKDKRVRQAVAYAINIDEIINSLLTGKEKRDTTLSTGSFGWKARTPLPFDPTQAKALLTQAGFANGFDTQLQYAAGYYNKAAEICQAIAGYLGKIGIRVKVIQLQDYGTLAALIRSKKAPGLSLFGQASGQNAYAAYFKNVLLSSGTNSLHPAVPEIEDIAKAALVEFDEQKRKDLIEQVVAKVYPEVWTVQLWELPSFYAFNKKKLNYEPSPYAENVEFDQLIPQA